MFRLETAPAPSSAAASKSAADPLTDPLQRDVAVNGTDKLNVSTQASAAVASAGSTLPHQERLQPLFGHHDLSTIRAHTNSASQQATRNAGANGLATGSDVAFAAEPDVALAAHEAAHIIQQRGGASPSGGVGDSGDTWEKNAEEVAELASRGESVEHLLDPFARSGGSNTAATGGPVQLSIGVHVGAAGDQFMIDNVRPGWRAHANNIPLAAGQARCHLIGFEVIQNDLARILNDMLAARGAPAAQQAGAAALARLCNSLFTSPGAPRNTMQAEANALVNALQALPAGPLNAGQRANLTQLSGHLLSSLNSCPDNLRAGDQGLNAAIGYSVDAEFAPGDIWYQGLVMAVGAIPAAAAAAPAGTIMGPAGAPGPGEQMTGPIPCIRLLPVHEAKAYSYQMTSGLALSFVVNGGAGAVNPAAPAGVQLSSTQLPTVAGRPVLIMGPNAGSVPLLYV